LLENLAHIDWSETTKTAQRNWIGRSEGAEISFATKDVNGGGCEIRVFTTRPDTIYGATYLVLAPEHPLVEQLIRTKEKKKVDAYREQDEEAGHHHAKDQHREDGGVHWLLRHKPGDRSSRFRSGSPTTC